MTDPGHRVLLNYWQVSQTRSEQIVVTERLRSCELWDPDGGDGGSCFQSRRISVVQIWDMARINQESRPLIEKLHWEGKLPVYLQYLMMELVHLDWAAYRRGPKHISQLCWITVEEALVVIVDIQIKHARKWIVEQEMMLSKPLGWNDVSGCRLAQNPERGLGNWEQPIQASVTVFGFILLTLGVGWSESLPHIKINKWAACSVEVGEEPGMFESFEHGAKCLN